MSEFWSNVVKTLTPYVPGEQPKLTNLVKLNTNENPYGASPRVLKAIREAVDEDLRLYPDPNAEALKEAIAEHYDVTTINVFVGNGSDEILAHVFLALLKHDQPVLFPDITYSFYPVYCGLYEIAFQTVPLAEDFSLRVADYSQPNGGIIFPNPNAPTGRAISLAEIEELLQMHPHRVIVIDEAYVDFGGESAIPLTHRYPNLLVVHTFSKSRSLAGLRVGFAIGHSDLIEALERVKNSFNSYPLDKLAMAGAIAALDDKAHFERTRKAIMHARENLIAALESLGFEVLPSVANFVFVRHPEHDAEKSALALRRHGIVVRHFKLPRIEQFLRITIGTDDQCAILVKALREIVA